MVNVMRGKVYSCSLFFRELDLLELKLETLDPLVDYFVISESTRTHSGKPKKLYFNKNRSRFKKFENKIIYQVIHDTPSKFTDLKHKTESQNYFWYNHIVDKINRQTHWSKNVESYGRDSWEKESLIRPLGCDRTDDIILLSDLDEIVKPEALSVVLNNFDVSKVYHFQHSMFYYFLNVQKTNEPWYGTIATTYQNFFDNSFCEMRTNKQGIFIKDAGWHFTFQNGKKAIRNKIESYGEQSLNKDFIKNNIGNSVDNFLSLGKDIFGRRAEFKIRDINDGTFPKYLVEHQDDIFKKLIYKNS